MGLQVGVLQPEAQHAGLGRIPALARQVHAQVLPEVDQLQGGADLVTLRKRMGVHHAVEVQQQAPHRVGRAAAIVQKRVFRGETLAGGGHAHVLLEGIEQLLQQVRGELEFTHHRPQGLEHTRPFATGGLLPGRGAQVVAKARQVGQAAGGAGFPFIGEVITGAGKPVNGGYDRSQARRAQPGGDRKVLVMVDRPGLCRWGMVFWGQWVPCLTIK